MICQDSDRCFYCERMFLVSPLNSNIPLTKTKDHIYPKSKGGILRDNFVYACHKCNTIKGDKTIEQFIYLIQNIIHSGRQIYKGYTVQHLQKIIANSKKLINHKPTIIHRKFIAP